MIYILRSKKDRKKAQRAKMKLLPSEKVVRTASGEVVFDDPKDQLEVHPDRDTVENVKE